MAAERQQTFQEGREAKVALPPNQSETSKDKRCEPRGRGGNKQGVIGGKGACWDEWLYLEEPDSA